MASACIILDVFDLWQDPQVDIHIEQVEAYPRACLLLREVLDSKHHKTVTIHVRHPVVGTWLAQRAQAYGEGRVTVVSITPRSLLGERWQITIPSDVSDDAIMRSHLLDLSPLSTDGKLFWDVLLIHFFGDVMGGKTFPLEHLSSLLGKFTPALLQEVAQRPLVAQAFQQRMEEWERRAKNEAVRLLVQRLRNEPQVFYQDLACYKLLRRYSGKLGEKVLEDMWELCQSLHIDVEDLPLLSVDVQRAVQEIRFYLANMVPKMTTALQFSELLQQMSGYVPQEFDVVEQLVRNHPEWLSVSLLQLIEHRFFPLQERLGVRLALLRHLLAPAFPPTPQIDWDAEQWLTWIEREYMPYYTWLDAQNRSDDAIAQQAFLFADWFYEHYRELKNSHPQLFTFTALFQEYEHITHEGAIVLALLVDNFNFVCFEELCQLFAQHQFVLETVQPRFSLIPTATEIGKAGILAGSDDLAHLGTRDYPTLLQKAWQSLLAPHEKEPKYLANLGQLRQLQKLEHAFYLLNYNPIDKTLHGDDRETGRSHREQVYDFLAALAKTVASFAQQFHIEHRLVIYLLSDHGSTKIHRKTDNVLPRDVAKPETAREKHPRFVAISEERLPSLPSVVSQQCYIVDKERFKTGESYLIAREYARFASTEEHFYVHGGLSPEEVVVPFARFTAQFDAPSPPDVRLLTTQFRYVIASHIQFEVRNLNAFPLQMIRLQLVSEQAEEVIINQLLAHEQTSITIVTRFRKVSGERSPRRLHLRLRYNVHNRQFGPQDETFEITLKSMMEEPDDFDL